MHKIYSGLKNHLCFEFYSCGYEDVSYDITFYDAECGNSFGSGAGDFNGGGHGDGNYGDYYGYLGDGHGECDSRIASVLLIFEEIINYA